MEEGVLSVIIVEDAGRVVRGLVETMPWSDWNARVVGSAYNGRDGLALWQRTRAELVLTDIRMPVLDGMAMAEAIGAEYAIAPAIVFLTAYGELPLLQQAIRLGATDYLLKPVAPDELGAAITRARGQSRNEASSDNGDMSNVVVSRICRHILDCDLTTAVELAAEWDALQTSERPRLKAALIETIEAPLSLPTLNVLGTAESRTTALAVYLEQAEDEVLSRLGAGGSVTVRISTGPSTSLVALSEITVEAIRGLPQPHRYVRDAIAFIRRSIGRPVSIREVSEAVYLTPSYICRLFKQETGMTIKQFVRREQISEARRLIDTSEYYALSDIASACGFGTYRYFTQTFTRIVGMTPSQYANRGLR